MISLRESILKSVSAGKESLIKKWCDEHNIFDGHYKINSDWTISPENNDFNQLTLVFSINETKLPDYIKFADGDYMILVVGEGYYNRVTFQHPFKLTSFEGFPKQCKILRIVCSQSLDYLPDLDIKLKKSFQLVGYGNIRNTGKINIQFTGTEADKELMIKTKLPLDHVKVKGATFINAVNDIYLGDAISKALARKLPMNKYRGKYTDPAPDQDLVEDALKSVLQGIETDYLHTVEYTQNSKIIKYHGLWYRTKNW